jgi:hypothetical protein
MRFEPADDIFDTHPCRGYLLFSADLNDRHVSCLFQQRQRIEGRPLCLPRVLPPDNNLFQLQFVCGGGNDENRSPHLHNKITNVHEPRCVYSAARAGTGDDKVSTARFARDVFRERTKRHCRSPFESSYTCLKHISEFRFGHLDLFFQLLSVLLDQVRGDVALAVVELHGFACHDTDHSSIEALCEVTCDLQ